VTIAQVVKDHIFNQRMASSNPSTALERTSIFLESLFQNVAVNQTDVNRKILSIKTEINKLKERRKKAKAALKASHAI
jgi:hypothetical protein